MQLHHEFALPVPLEQAWDTLLDVPRVARCMPGATLDRADGDEFSGRVTLKVGPLRMSYRGDARITERDERARRLVLNAVGKESRGAGTAEATVTVALSAQDGGTRAVLDTELALTGRAAQFGQGLVSEVAGTVIGQFADRLAHEMRGGEGESAPALPQAPEVGEHATASPTEARTSRQAPAEDRKPESALDVLGLVRPVLGTRAGWSAGAVLLALCAFLLGRRGRRSQPWGAGQQVVWPVPVIVDRERS